MAQTAACLFDARMEAAHPIPSEERLFFLQTSPATLHLQPYATLRFKPCMSIRQLPASIGPQPSQLHGELLATHEP